MSTSDRNPCLVELPPDASALIRETAWRRIDCLVVAMQQLPQVECPIVDFFTPGLYTRQILMPAGTIVVSKIHNTFHPFVISQGRVSVWSLEKGWKELSAPHTGVTTPGTRRVLVVHEDTIWTTFHPTTRTTVEDVEADIIEKRDLNPAEFDYPDLHALPLGQILESGATL